MKILIDIGHSETALVELRNAIQFLERAPINGSEATPMLNAVTRIRTIGLALEQATRNLDFSPAKDEVGTNPQIGEEEGR
ncbi:MAG: hypothetical protein GWP74_19205 [Proteobacteria bacterium]|nr:hypothetical protein [Pseudomonadota bacterium]